MTQFCPRKYSELAASAPEGPIASSLPVIATGPGERLINCDCGNGVSLEELGGLTGTANTLGNCALSGISISEAGTES